MINITDYGYSLKNNTGRNLWWDEIADCLLSKQLIEPRKKFDSGSLTTHNGNLMLALYFDAVKISFVMMRVNDLGNEHTGEPENGIHERYRIRICKFPKDSS